MSETVLVTGATGYIAKHIVAGLLNRGYNVVGSARSIASHDQIKSAVAPMLEDPTDLDNRLRTVALDLNSDAGWTEAMQNADALMHTASPFPLEQPKDAQEVIRPAVDGAVRALKAANDVGLKRVIFTSSTVAVATGDLRPGKSAFDEEDWSDLNHATASPYAQSKTMAERAAWDFLKSDAPDMEMTVINPGFVLGAPLDDNYGTSVKVIERILSGKDPMVPKIGFSTVDVRDIAEMHIRALEQPETAGERILGVSEFLWFSEISAAVSEELPDRRIALREAPNFFIRLLGLFDPAIKSIVPTLGKAQPVDNSKARQLLKMEFRDVRDAARETAAYLARHNLA